MAKRLVRARQKIAQAGIAYRIRTAKELPARLVSVHAVLHLAFTTDHHSTDDTVMRAALCDEAIRLAGLVVDMVPDDPSATALLALFLLTDARRPGRLGPDGSLIPLAEQDRRRWDRVAVAEGVGLLRLYRLLADVYPSPAVQLNAAVACAEVDAPAAALAALDDVPDAARTHLYHAARADLLRRLGHDGEAAAALSVAVAEAPTEAERDHLRRQRAILAE